MKKAGEEDSAAGDDNRSRPVKGKSCKGTLYYSSILRSKGRNPRCIGLSESLEQVPSYVVRESEAEASKEGRNLPDFKYACVGYSVYLDNEDASNGEEKPRAQWPVCVGLEFFADKSPVADHASAHAHSREDDCGFPHPRLHKPAQSIGDEFLTKFTRNASLVASGVARNMRKMGNYLKDTVDDMLHPYRRRSK